MLLESLESPSPSTRADAATTLLYIAVGRPQHFFGALTASELLNEGVVEASGAAFSAAFQLPTGTAAELSSYAKLLIVLIVRGRGLEALTQALTQSRARRYHLRCQRQALVHPESACGRLPVPHVRGVGWEGQNALRRTRLSVAGRPDDDRDRHERTLRGKPIPRPTFCSRTHWSRRTCAHSCIAAGSRHDAHAWAAWVACI
jgi:hypothetical protein